MSGPFVDQMTYPFDRIKRLPIFMTEGTGATPSLEGSRAMARYMREGGFAFEYLEVEGNHGSMVPMVWPRIFEFFNRQGQAPPPRAAAPGPHGVAAEFHPALATRTAHHPTNLEGFGPSNRLPIVSWGGGACARSGSACSVVLTRIASHHGGADRQPGGGWFGEVAVARLDYQLKDSAEAARWFVGADCRLCIDPLLVVEKKGMR
jgi:hypothetical protein